MIGDFLLLFQHMDIVNLIKSELHREIFKALNRKVSNGEYTASDQLAERNQ